MVHRVDNASPALQVAPAIDAHLISAYAFWQSAANALLSAHDAVAARYMRSVAMWLRYKPTLVALANAPLTARHWHELWARRMNTPYVHGFTLGDLIKHDAFEHAEAICAIACAASDAHALEPQLEVPAAHRTRAPPSSHAVRSAVVCTARALDATRPSAQRAPRTTPRPSVTACRNCDRW